MKVKYVFLFLSFMILGFRLPGWQPLSAFGCYLIFDFLNFMDTKANARADAIRGEG